MWSMHSLLVSCCCVFLIGAAPHDKCDAMLELFTDESSLSEGMGDINRRSLSPWTWRMSTFPNQIPLTLWEAECSSSCSPLTKGEIEGEKDGETEGEGDLGLSAVPILQDILLLQKKPDSNCFTASFHRVAVGCTCVRAYKSQA